MALTPLKIISQEYTVRELCTNWFVCAIWMCYIHSVSKTLSYFGGNTKSKIYYFWTLKNKYKSNIIIRLANLKKSAIETQPRLNFIPELNKNVVNSVSNKLKPQLNAHCILLKVIILTFLFFIQRWALC